MKKVEKTSEELEREAKEFKPVKILIDLMGY